MALHNIHYAHSRMARTVKFQHDRTISRSAEYSTRASAWSRPSATIRSVPNTNCNVPNTSDLAFIAELDPVRSSASGPSVTSASRSIATATRGATEEDCSIAPGVAPRDAPISLGFLAPQPAPTRSSRSLKTPHPSTSDRSGGTSPDQCDVS